MIINVKYQKSKFKKNLISKKYLTKAKAMKKIMILIIAITATMFAQDAKEIVNTK